MPEEWRLRPEERNGHPKTFTAAELMACELSPVLWIVQDILPGGVTFLAGKPKMGKSFMALGLGIAIAAGGVALGTRRVEQGEVLYLALEDNRRRLQNRLHKLLAGRPAPTNLHIATDWRRLDEGGLEDLDAWVGEHPHTRLVVIDTLARFKPHASGRRSAYDEDREAVDPLIPLAAEKDLAILLVHHLRETESDDPLDMITGSVGLTGGVDGALVLKRQRGRADAFLHVEGRDIENPTELALKFDPEAATWAIVGDAEEYRVSQERQEIMRVLEEADEPMGPKEVAELLDKSTNAVKYLMWKMSKDGQLATVGKGRYSITTNLANPLTDEHGSGGGSVSAVSEVSGLDTEVRINEDGEAEF
jgi:hypothetical protein